MHAGRVDRVHRVHAGDHASESTGPVSSWINWPNIVSSCGGRPTTVNGQIASGAMVHALDAQHRKVVRQAVVAQVIAERALGQLALGIDGAA